MTAARSDATDEMLMVRYQRGERQAFAELVRRYKTPVYNFALRHVRHAAAAEDVTQEVFLRVVQNAGSFKHESRFSTWIYTIVRNRCVDELRRRAHRRHASLDQPAAGKEAAGPRLVDKLADPHPRSSVERSSISGEVGGRMIEAIDGLPEEQREVFLLREVACLPFKDIAEITGTGENTVKSRMRYALDRLQQALAEFEEYARALR